MIIVEVAGYLGSDAEERFTPNGKRVISLRIAARVRQGGKDETVWWRVSIWGDRYDKILPYLKKGTAVIVIGEMGKPEVYVGKDGQSQISLSLNAEIVKFSPFGRPERPGEASDKPSHSESLQYAGAGMESGAQQYAGAGMEKERYAASGASFENDSFAGDDLPF